MADSKDDALVKSVEGLLAEKQAVAEREKKLIEDLNAALAKMGYKVVSTKAVANGGKRPDRPPGSGKGQAPKAPGAKTGT